MLDMRKILLNLFLIIKLSTSQRRITNGTRVDVDVDTSFVVYIVAARVADSNRGWLCGGSIIHPSLVLTSASCLTFGTNTKQMYVIPGYRKYVSTENLEKNACTRRMKLKIRSYCVHYYYASDEQEFINTNDQTKYKWLKFDIGVARTETPIDFYDIDYLKYCSYLPSTIRTNYNSRYERPTSNVVAFGWGHAVYFRPDGDLNDYNEEYLRSTSTRLLSRQNCQKSFDNDYIKKRVANHFICTDGVGVFNAKGRYSRIVKPSMHFCSRRHDRRSSNNSEVDNLNVTSCFEDDKFNETSSYNETTLNNETVNGATRRNNGICQNDHGGPLVRWIGGRPYVVGVAAAFRVNKNMECIGPSMYSSVLCNSLFINCMLQDQNTIKESRRTISKCNDPERGLKIEETEVDWSYEDF